MCSPSVQLSDEGRRTPRRSLSNTACRLRDGRQAVRVAALRSPTAATPPGLALPRAVTCGSRLRRGLHRRRPRSCESRRDWTWFCLHAHTRLHSAAHNSTQGSSSHPSSTQAPWAQRHLTQRFTSVLDFTFSPWLATRLPTACSVASSVATSAHYCLSLHALHE